MESLTVHIRMSPDEPNSIQVTHRAADGDMSTWYKGTTVVGPFDTLAQLGRRAIGMWVRYGRVGVWSWANECDATLVSSVPSSDEDEL